MKSFLKFGLVQRHVKHQISASICVLSLSPKGEGKTLCIEYDYVCGSLNVSWKRDHFESFALILLRKMSRAEFKKASLCTSEPFCQETVSNALSVFSKIVKSCYGPTGRLKQLHNGMGGYVRTTSQSSVLLSGLSVTHPVLKLLTASVQNHLSRFSDGGLFTAILCCNLIEKFQSLNVASCTFVKIIQHLLSLCIDYLTSKACGCKIPVDFSSSDILRSLVRSVLTSKRACGLSRKEADHISTLLLKAFLYTVPQNVEPGFMLGKCLYISMKEKRIMDSVVYPGLLIEIPDSGLTRMLPVRRAPSCMIKVALFSVSLSGELPDTGEGVITAHQDLSLEAVVLNQLLHVGKQMVNDCVGLALCQKVIHPALKQYLKENHIIAVERVGVVMMEPLKQITGCQPIPSLKCLSPECYGYLKDLQTQCFASKHFLHLISHDPIVCSFLLCNRNETASNELKLACQTAEHVLKLTISDPWVLVGGGCTETHLSSYIRHKSHAVASSASEALCCSQAEFQIVAESFCCSLESVAQSLEHDDGGILLDTTWGHSWSVPPNVPCDLNWSEFVCKCGCGLFDKPQRLNWRTLQCPSSPSPPESCINASFVSSVDGAVLDCFAAKRNGLQVAVETASLLLDLSYLIEDCN